MSASTNANAVPREDLMTLVREHIEETDVCVAQRVLPVLPVRGPEVQWPYIKPEQLLNVYDTRRAERGNYNRKGIKYDWTNTKIHEYGLETPVNPDVAARYRDWFDAEEQETEILVDDMRRDLEVRTADLVFGAGAFSGKTTGVSTEWSTAASSTPMTDAKVARAAVRAQCGMVPDACLMTWAVRENLNLNAQIKDWIKYTNGVVGEGQLPDSIIAQALGVKEIIVAGAAKNTAGEGLTGVFGDIWDDEYVLFFKKSTGNIGSPMGVGLGRIPLWADSSPTLMFVESYAENQTRSEVVRCRNYAEPKLLHEVFGHRLSNITA